MVWNEDVRLFQMIKDNIRIIDSSSDRNEVKKWMKERKGRYCRQKKIDDLKKKSKKKKKLLRCEKHCVHIFEMKNILRY